MDDAELLYRVRKRIDELHERADSRAYELVARRIYVDGPGLDWLLYSHHKAKAHRQNIDQPLPCPK